MGGEPEPGPAAADQGAPRRRQQVRSQRLRGIGRANGRLEARLQQ
ncbi:MAG TPA: hypothetical protein VLW55_22315 [Burkholderiaceae bacterium]|nr:hypothetical protein [Burkholderiaceae bacterium]